MQIVDCRINHLDHPLGFDFSDLRVSWKVADASGKYTKNARIKVSESYDFSNIIYEKCGEDLSPLGTTLELELKPYTRYYWTVEVISNIDEYAISEIQWFETAKESKPWESIFISCDQPDENNPVFTKSFNLSEAMPDARLYICGLGLYTVSVNGKRVGEEYLTPGCNNYHMWLQYQTYPISLNKGNNKIEISLGNGWYKGRFGQSGSSNIYGSTFQLIAEIRNKGDFILGTDTSWHAYHGAIIQNGIYDGEVYKPAVEKRLLTVVKGSEDCTKLSARLSVPVKVVKTVKPASLLRTPAGELILDMGQNMVGFIRCEIEEPEGSEIKFQFGEILQNGNFYNGNLRTAKAEYRYISDGKKHILEPAFTYFGFRYVKIEGLVDCHLDQFTGCVLSTVLPRTGMIHTSDEKINRLFENIYWGQIGNFIDIPTDCPQRDERLGWTGDIQVFSRTALFNSDAYTFLNKYVKDIEYTQNELGVVTNCIPAFEDKEATSCAWGDAATILPWNVYQTYGDTMILKQQYESMKAWVRYERSCAEESGNPYLWETEKGFGDWLAQDHDDPEERFAGGTELTFLHTAYYYHSVCIFVNTAEILGKMDDYAEYSVLKEKIYEAFIREYFTASGRLAVSTQTAYAVVLAFELVPEGYKDDVITAFVKKIDASGVRIKTGFIGTPLLCPMLSEYGHSALAYELLFHEDVPGWLYAVNLGATTIWERWNSLLPDGTINGTDMNSFNHYSYGSIGEWMYRYMAGITQLKPGFQKVKIEPRMNVRLKSVAMIYDSPAGTYKIMWEMQSNHHIFLEVEVPFDTQAEIHLPGKEEVTLVEAGRYTFDYETNMPLWKRVNSYASFSELKKFPPAAPILDRYMPGWKNIPSVFCKDSLRVIAKVPVVGLSDETLDKIDELLEL